MTSIRYHSEPLPYLVADDFLGAADLAVAAAAWPDAAWPGWRPECDAPLPPSLAVLLARLAAQPVSRFFDAAGAVPDLSLYGAGLHEMHPGSRVGLHQDAGRHPRLGLARLLSAVCYVHERWDAEWGGELVLGRQDQAVLQPAPGRLVVFDCRGAWHEVSPVRCPEGISRRSLACFFYLPAAGEGSVRAQFAT